MSALRPGFADQLSARAEALAAEHAGGLRRRAVAGTPRRPHLPRGRTLGLSILVAGVALSGAAYASQSLWKPVIGSPDFHRATGRATASKLPAQQLTLLSVLRRPQTEADRGAASRYALTFQGGDVIRTNEVRLLTPLPHGSAAVLIPVAKRGSGHAMPTQSDHDLLCLWLRDPVDGGGQQCGTTGQLASGMLTLGISAPALPQTRTQQTARAAKLKRAIAIAKRLHRSYIRMPMAPGQDRITTVGLVPDAVAAIKLDRSTQLIPVHHNIYVTTRRALDPNGQVWLDARGRVIPKLGVGSISLFEWPPTKHPGLAQRALDAYYASQNARSAPSLSGR